MYQNINKVLVTNVDMITVDNWKNLFLNENNYSNYGKKLTADVRILNSVIAPVWKIGTATKTLIDNCHFDNTNDNKDNGRYYKSNGKDNYHTTDDSKV